MSKDQILLCLSCTNVKQWLYFLAKRASYDGVVFVTYDVDKNKIRPCGAYSACRSLKISIKKKLCTQDFNFKKLQKYDPEMTILMYTVAA
jgi:hypothetical protein